MYLGDFALFRQTKVNRASVGENAAMGVNEITNVCKPPGAISTGVLAVPVTALVEGSVV
jgi:hypothetical protein